MTQTNFVVDREKLEVRMSRVFDVPRELVWKVLTDPTLIPEWWGPRNLKTIVDKMEVKASGAWRYIQKDEQGNEYGFNGVYKEVNKPELISDTFNYEPIGPGHELRETLRLEELEGGKTKITSISYYNTIEDLEGMVASGMEAGARESWDRLDELLEKMKKARRM